MTSDDELLAKVNALIEPFGCLATELGPDSVGVQGDARFYGPCVFISVPKEMEPEDFGNISTKITNEIPGISRVLINIPTT